MGIVGSWVATWCWSVASEKLPLAITAQLIVAETVFGLIFGFIYEYRLPDLTEYIGGALQILGITTTLYLFARTTEQSKE
jgi:drug/metabolite transporter (DMT)-like permease